jgi:Glycosyl hydrolase family 71
MRRLGLAVGLVCLLNSVGFAGNLAIVPTTTVAAQTSNNTSTANGFLTQSDGNLGAGNISKVNLHSLLYPGASTKIYAHMVLWFGQSNHMDVGYNSADAGQIKRQIADMISRGIDGVIVDWHGPDNSIDDATQLVMKEAEAHPGFIFSIMVDQAAIRWDSCSGCTPQQALIQQLQYVEQKYFPSPAYMRVDGAPVVTSFDIDLSYAIDWNTVQDQLATKPVFIFQNNEGFSHALSDGSFSWVIPTTSDYGMAYLTSFYNTGLLSPQKNTVGAGYKGFDDSLAAWGTGRVMGQQCGETWLQTFAKINTIYSSTKQLPFLQLVTWNDYEEGSEIETGIDNCVNVAAEISNDSLQWSIGGDQQTIDHYTAYISRDGQKLMPLADLAPGLHSLNLCSFSLPSGNYTLYAQAVGKPGLNNHLSGAIRYTPHCSAGMQSAVGITTTPASVTVAAGKPGITRVALVPQTGPFNHAISLSCSGLPQQLVCSFTPAVVTPASNGSTSTLTISSTTVSASRYANSRGLIYAAYLLIFGVVDLAAVARRRKRTRVVQISLIVVLAGLIALLASCGGGPSSAQPVSNGSLWPGTYTITIDGNSGALQVSTPATVTVQ